MKNSINELTNVSTKFETLTKDQQAAVKGGCRNYNDPRRC
jgi:hypothetical protein